MFQGNETILSRLVEFSRDYTPGDWILVWERLWLCISTWVYELHSIINRKKL